MTSASPILVVQLLMIHVIEGRHCILTLCLPHNQLQQDCCPAEHSDCDFMVYLQPDLLGSAKDGNQTCQAAWVGAKNGSYTLRYMSMTYMQAVVISRRKFGSSNCKFGSCTTVLNMQVWLALAESHGINPHAVLNDQLWMRVTKTNPYHKATITWIIY